MSEEQRILDAYLAWAFSDVDAVDYLIDPQSVLARVSERTGIPLDELTMAFERDGEPHEIC